jgi:adenylate cyclase
MNAEITIQIEGQPPRMLALSANCTIGRGRGNDLLLDDSRVSRNHALIRLLGEQRFYLVDLGSANGTFLNGRPVMVPAELKSGDKIQIAGFHLRFHQAGQADGHRGDSAVQTSVQTITEMSQQTVALLVVDIRNYSGLAEAMSTNGLSRFIGNWFRETSQVIEKHGGTIDKFIGDAIFAYWLRTSSHDTKYIHGPLHVARDFVQRAAVHHVQLTAARPDLAFAIGCAVHAGEAILGSVGGVTRRDFTAVGDCVNVAFRLESLCKELKRPILASRAVKEVAGAGFGFEDLGPHIVKGKAESIHVFALRD